MSPILSSELAAAHRADLLRYAEARRRAAAAATTHHRSLWARLAERAEEIVGRVRRPAAGTALSGPAVCCA